jgi:hypothetical protein
MATESTREQPSGLTTFLWAIFFFFIFAVVVVMWVRNSGPKLGYEDKRAGERLAVRQEREKEAREKLTTTALVDPANGIARIPIADAKLAIIDQLKAKQVAPSAVKVDPWLPMPPPPDPNATEPPPPALPSAPQGADTIRFESAQPATK